MIFVDTSAFVSLVVKTDKFHSAALTWWEENKGASLITSNLVIIETLGWVRNKNGKEVAVEFGKNVLLGGDIKIERFNLQDEQKAWKLFTVLDGRGVSMIDCISFMIMKRLKVREVFAFDEDFKKLGFKVYP